MIVLVIFMQQTSDEASEAEMEEVKQNEEAKIEEEEEEEVFEYDYEQMKSTPAMVNVSTSNMLQLQYAKPQSVYLRQTQCIIIVLSW